MNYFPHPLTSDDEGLVAMGGDLSVDRLKLAYSCGIFPWYNQPPILWWFTHPRCVLRPTEIKISKSMRSLMKKGLWKVTLDKSFNSIIDHCAQIKRSNQYGTWITSDIRDSYLALHQSGYAHSIEVWDGYQLIGGLYGVLMGQVFYGESMFSSVSNASKYALIYLAQFLAFQGCTMIDCQQDTPHMRSMGAILMPKKEFWKVVRGNMILDDLVMTSEAFGDWLANP